VQRRRAQLRNADFVEQILRLSLGHERDGLRQDARDTWRVGTFDDSGPQLDGTATRPRPDRW
jgi:hypothetical protein